MGGRSIWQRYESMLYSNLEMKLSPQTVKKLKQQKIGIVYHFGSRTQSPSEYMSDFDIGVVFTDPLQIKNLVDVHPLVYSLFSQEFPVTFNNDVDIVYVQETSLNFQFHIISEGKILYEFNPIFRADYEERVIKEYLDFQPIERIFSEAILERTE